MRSALILVPRRILLAALASTLIAGSCAGPDPGNAASTSTIAEIEASPNHETLEDGSEADTADHHDPHDSAIEDHHDSTDDADTADHHGAAGEPTRYDAPVADADQTISVEVVSGDPVGGHQRVRVDLGSTVALMVTSDTAAEIHVHGYDILRAVSDGHPAHFAFAAEIPGVFEVEVEGSGRLLFLLEIS